MSHVQIDLGGGKNKSFLFLIKGGPQRITPIFYLFLLISYNGSAVTDVHLFHRRLYKGGDTLSWGRVGGGGGGGSLLHLCDKDGSSLTLMNRFFFVPPSFVRLRLSREKIQLRFLFCRKHHVVCACGCFMLLKTLSDEMSFARTTPANTQVEFPLIVRLCHRATAGANRIFFLNFFGSDDWRHFAKAS